MDSKLPLQSTCAEQIYKDMFTPTYQQCSALQSQALPTSSAIGPYFLASVPLASIPSTALISMSCGIASVTSYLSENEAKNLQNGDVHIAQIPDFEMEYLENHLAHQGW